jgi:hypothetical protein
VSNHVVDFEPRTHTYGIDGVPVISVTQVLVEAGIIDTKWFTTFARHRGSMVHRAIQFRAEGVLDLNSIDPKIQGYLDAEQRFIDDLGFVCEESERIVYSASRGFAGSLDQLGHTPGYRCIVDYKTGPPGRPTGIQLTGYADALKEETGEYVDRLLAVQLMVDGRYKLFPYRANFKVWRGALEVAKWKREK